MSQVLSGFLDFLDLGKENITDFESSLSSITHDNFMVYPTRTIEYGH